MIAQQQRRGYTVFEMVVVLAIILIIGAVVLPSMAAFQGDTRQRAGVDVVRSELSDARGRAREENKPYRVAISEDGTRIRREADGPDFGTAPAESAGGSAATVEYAFDHVTIDVTGTPTQPVVAENGWITFATLMPDGTCREDSVLLTIKDEDKSPLYAQLRGLTSTVRVVPNPNANGGTR